MIKYFYNDSFKLNIAIYDKHKSLYYIKGGPTRA